MPRIKDEIGKKYGRLLVVEYAGIDKYTHAQWKCICDCGDETIVSGTNLRKGGTKSCGCLRIETGQKNGRSTRLPDGEASLRGLYRKYRYGAIGRDLLFGISLEEFRGLTKSNCYYCGIEPKQKYDWAGRCPTEYIYNGVDRVDNTKGYIIDNCVPCCFSCNQAKAKQTKEEFISLVRRIYKNLELG